MKKITCIFAAAILLLSTACSGNQQKADNATETEVKEQFEEDINAGADPQVEAASNLVNLENSDLNQLKAEAGKVLAIDFGATWCGPCQKFHPTFDEAAEKYPDVKFVYVDVDENEEAAAKFNVESVPTIIVIDTKGNETRYTGIGDLLPSEKFFSIIENASK